ncbi:MAG TPA: AAA family ATPase [Jatrophihabitantaceae bacterium]
MSDSPLLGRERELADIDQRIDRARQGQPGVLLVAGAVGIGKTSLVQEAARRSRSAGMVVVSGRADESAAPALWLWERVFDRLGVDAGAATAVATPAAEDAAIQRFRTLHRLAAAVAERAPPAGLAILLEDLQWADEASIAMLRAMVDHLGDQAILLVATHRDVPIGGSGALAEALPALRSRPGVGTAWLRPLEAPAVHGVLLGELGDPVPDAVGELVAQRTGGNPLFVQTVARLLRQLPPAGRDVGAVEWLSTEPELRGVVAAWAATLSPRCREVLAAASVVGEQFGGNDIAALLDEDASAAIEDAIAAEAIVAANGGRFEFSHSLVRDAVYAELPDRRRRELHRRLAARLERHAGDGHAAEIAEHWSRAAIDDAELLRAVEWWARAGAAADRKAAWSDATRFYAAAVDAAERAHAPEAQLAGGLVDLARAAYRAGRLPDAVQVATRASITAQEAGDATALVDAALVVQGIGSPPVNVTLLELADRALPAAADAATRARLLAVRASALSALDRVEESVDQADAALHEARESGDPLAELDALRARHLVLAAPRELDERITLAERTLALAGQLASDAARMWALLWLVDAGFAQGDLAAVDARIGALQLLNESSGLALGRWHFHRLEASRCAVIGQFADSRKHADLAAAEAHALGDQLMVGLTQTFLVEFAMMLGDPDQLPPESADMFRFAPRLPLVDATRARLLLLGGERDRAERIYRTVAAALPGLPDNGRKLPTHVLTTDLAIAFDDRNTAAWLYDALLECQGTFLAGSAGTVFCHGPADLVLGRLAATAGELDTALRHIDAAGQAAERSGAVPYVALSKLAAAEVEHRRGDDDGRSRRLASEAAELADSLGMPGPAARARRLAAAGAPGPLTTREQEIAQLVARGLTNKEIAARLVLSERTVESHIRNAMLRLGLNRRVQLAKWTSTHIPEQG